MTEYPTSTRQKALALNLDRSKYGTIAEIGAGQEVARWLFVVGGAAGTIAKTISVYDKEVSDSIYGRSPRYVSRQRLQAMLESEFHPLLDQATGKVVTIESWSWPIGDAFRHLRSFLVESGRLVPIQRYDESLLSIYTKDVLARIRSGDASWETMVPPAVADTIRTKRLFALKA